MKSPLPLVGALAALGLTSSMGATNILVDSGFEMSTANSQSNPVWNLEANQPDGTGFSAQYQDAGWASNPNGDPGVGLWLKAFEGAQAAGDALANATASQTVAVMGGLSYELSVWSKQEANYTAASTFFSVDFLDGSDNVLSMESSNIDSHPKDGSWQNYTLSTVAPAGATSAVVRVGMVDGMDAQANPQSAMFDDVELRAADAIPEPSVSLLGLLGASLLFRRRRS